VQDTTKAVILERDNECPEIVDFSVYDTKPVNFLSTACIVCSGRKNTNKVFDKDAGIKIMLKFLCLGVMDEYNY
jgi:hypothetical protein